MREGPAGVEREEGDKGSVLRTQEGLKVWRPFDFELTVMLSGVMNFEPGIIQACCLFEDD